MNDPEQKVFIETRLRNLKRAYVKMLQHSDLTDVAGNLKEEIKSLENELAMM